MIVQMVQLTSPSISRRLAPDFVFHGTSGWRHVRLNGVLPRALRGKKIELGLFVLAFPPVTSDDHFFLDDVQIRLR